MGADRQVDWANLKERRALVSTGMDILLCSMEVSVRHGNGFHFKTALHTMKCRFLYSIHDTD
jgi:hypothetical protein